MLKSRLAIGLLLLAMPAVADTPARPAVDPKAQAELRRMAATLSAAKTLSVDVYSTSEQYASGGQAVQIAKNQKITVRRPDRATAVVVGDREHFQFFYDGTRAVVFNPDVKAFASIDAPKTLDETLDLLATKYGMTLPLADLVFSDPYKVLTENSTSAQHLGTGYVFDTPCHHLAFSQESVDWEIWIATDGDPLPRKMSITYKLLPGQPRYTAFLSNWNLSADAPDAQFAFTPPPDAKEVPWSAPTTQPAAEAPTGKRTR